MDFKFRSHKPRANMQSNLLQHKHKKNFVFLRDQNPEPHFRDMAYFHIYCLKQKIFLMHVSKEGVLHLCTWLVRVKLEIHLIYGGSKLKTITLRRKYRKGLFRHLRPYLWTCLTLCLFEFLQSHAFGNRDLKQTHCCNPVALGTNFCHGVYDFSAR